MEFFSASECLSCAMAYFGDDVLAADQWVRKYALKNKDKFVESCPDDMHIRLAKAFNRMETKLSPNPISIDRFYDGLKFFKRIVPQGSPMYGIDNPYALASVSNCFIVKGPDDSIESIFNTARDMAQIMKRRGGVGVDISGLRPEGMRVNNSANTSSGAWSFSDFFSYCGRMIGQNGRGGAEMITMDIRHPDSEKFATMKSDLTKVTGANVSLKITDDFMRAVEDDTDFELRWPIEGTPKISKSVRARKLWKVIVECAQKNGEPGLLMWDNICNNLPAHYFPGFAAECVNPCAELVLSPYDSCRLISINLTGYVINKWCDDCRFDTEAFARDVELAMYMSDDLVELEIEAIDKIRQSVLNDSSCSDELGLWDKILNAATQGRRTGLGTHGLGDCLAMLAVRYDSEQAIPIVDSIYKTLRDASYRASIKLAKERGPFPAWQLGADDECEYIKRLPEDIKEEMKIYGRRNISLLTNAPTGTVSMMSQTSSGIEPIYEFEYDRRVKLTWDDVPLSVDFVDDVGDKWHKYSVQHPAFLDWMQHSGFTKINGHKIPDFFVTADKIDIDMRVKIQGTIQQYIDHGVSSTLNLPAGSTIEDVERIYLQSWKCGLKGVTVYVDGSRDGVLLKKGTDAKTTQPEIIRQNTFKRPVDLGCEINRVKHSNGENWIVLVSLVGDEPYEVFAGLEADLSLPPIAETACIRKLKARTYAVVYPVILANGECSEAIIPIRESFTQDNGMLVRLLVNAGLRHGMPIETIYQTVMKSSDITDFSRVVARVLKKYINTEKSGYKMKCKECGGSLIPYDGCFQCTSCGLSRCE